MANNDLEWMVGRRADFVIKDKADNVVVNLGDTITPQTLLDAESGEWITDLLAAAMERPTGNPTGEEGK